MILKTNMELPSAIANCSKAKRLIKAHRHPLEMSLKRLSPR